MTAPTSGRAAALLEPLTESEPQALPYAAGRIAALLDPGASRAVTPRALRPGDTGWTVSRHGALYAREYGVAQLRPPMVEPVAQGLGISKLLVDECTRFARAAGYEPLASEAHESFGQQLVGETWELGL